MHLHITVHYNGDAKTFVKEFDESFFPSEEGINVIGKERFDELVRSNIVDDFYSNFSLEIRNEKGEEI